MTQDTDALATNVEKAIKSYTCYLYVGNENPFFKVKTLISDDEHYQQCHESVEILAADKKTELLLIDKIKLAMDSSLMIKPDTLMFALAMCARQKKSEKLRASAYYFLAEHCKKWEHFILFIKYATYLCRSEGSLESNKHRCGWGRGWKNAVNKWYLRQDATELAKLVTRYRGAYGWTHKDIFKLSHPDTKSLEPEKRAVIKYVVRGLDEAEKEYGSDPKASSILKYIRTAEEFRSCRDKTIYQKGITFDDLTIDHVHPEALKYTKVWEHLTTKMDLRTILTYLPKLASLGMLTKLSPITQSVVRVLISEDLIRWNNVLPAEIVKLLIRCEGRSNMHELLQRRTTDGISSNRKKKSSDNKNSKETEVKRGTTDKRTIKQPDVTICNALRQTLNVAQTVNITNASERRYLVLVKLPGISHNEQCIEAALSIALPLFHRPDMTEDGVMVYCYRRWRNSGCPLNITKDTNYHKALEECLNLRNDNNSLSRRMSKREWIEGKKFDVIIRVTDVPPHKNFPNLMKSYRESIGAPEARFINVIVNKRGFTWKPRIWQDVLTIDGFDEHVPWIIEAYARGLF